MAGRKERQRKLARERYLRREARRAQRDRKARQWTITVLAAVAVIAVGVGSVLFFSLSKKPAAAAQPTAAAPPSTPAATPSPSTTPSASATAPAVTEPARNCVYTARPPAARKVSLPPAKPDYKATYTATIHTNRGNVVISLLNSKATCTVNSFVHLAAQKYFTNTKCHRLTTTGIFVLQCGDPTGTGSGGPGYTFDDENLNGAKYTTGTVAMANSGANTNGSQFFLVYKDSPLGASYTPFGTITSGLNIILKVAKAGSDNSSGQPGDGHPIQKVVITSVTIKKT